MNKIGYARVSSLDQNIDRQIQVLEKQTTKIFTDKESGTSRKRQGLKELLDYIRTDDIVVVTELDRLSRNNEHLTEIMGIIQSKGATLEVLNFPSLLGIKDDNLRKLLNNLILEIIKYQAQAERDRIRERQRQGIELAKKRGRYKGRKPLFKRDDKKLIHAFDLYLGGKTDKEVEEMTGINRVTFRRYRLKYNIKR
ncbi:recombinase family protein [Streptococcus sp. HMSC10E12]|uniref:recombinase family protein n=1 Tax=Streptococcus sp. HMSC10E12 TaxID=1581080 RepID=UPI0008A3BB04|nr:recombinase family protein [Streptococcus sp. HMSC10E12]OFU82391.1 Pin-related site-specific recombinase/DNA invertase [Streptococcus sp. HMSC10E12]